MKTIGYIFITIVMVIYANILNGFALSKLWLWFIVPTFNLSPLSIGYAIGLALVVTYLTHQIDDKEETGSYNMRMFKNFVFSTFKPAFALLFGYILKLIIS